MTTKYIIGGQLLAEAPSLPHTQTHFFICPKCGSHWATVFVEGTDFYLQRSACASHEWAGGVPGSILCQIFDAEMHGPMSNHVSLSWVPKEILAYELEVTLKAYEKGVFDEHETRNSQ